MTIASGDEFIRIQGVTSHSVYDEGAGEAAHPRLPEGADPEVEQELQREVVRDVDGVHTDDERSNDNIDMPKDFIDSSDEDDTADSFTIMGKIGPAPAQPPLLLWPCICHECTTRRN